MQSSDTAIRALAKAVRFAGSAAALAGKIGVTPQALSQWKDGVPLKRVLAVEAATGGRVKREELRPDLFRR